MLFKNISKAMHKTVKFYTVPETTIVLSYKEEGVAPGQLQIKYCRGVHLVAKVFMKNVYLLLQVKRR